MQNEPCHLVTNNGNFFDITHTFKAGLATYHILGLRKDRPTYNNTYYVFNCTDIQHNNEIPLARSLRIKRSEQNSSSLDCTRRISTENMKTRSISSRSRTHTESTKKDEINLENIQQELTKTIRNNRELLLTSIRKEMNLKKKSILQTMKKDKQTLLQTTKERNKNDEIIHLLEEHKQTLINLYEKSINTTNDSIDSLKKTLINMLENQQNTTQSKEQFLLTLIQVIEQEVKKNEEILRLTSNQTNLIKQLQNTILKKIEDQSNLKKNQDDETIKRIFAEQQQVLTNVIEQQQQTFSIDLIKQTIIDVFNEQKSTTINTTNHSDHPQQSINNTIPITSSEQYLPKRLTNLRPNQSLSKLTRKIPVDHHLFKISIHSTESAHLFAKLIIDGIECSRRLHTLCQRDPIEKDLFNCYIAPPNKEGPYEVTIYAKTNQETIYRSTISIRLPGSNRSQSISFPMIHQSFEQHQCILIEPFHRYLQRNEQILIHMIIPGAHLVKIQNGDENIELNFNEYKNNVMKKKIRVRGDVYISACWDNKTDSIICVFNVI